MKNIKVGLLDFGIRNRDKLSNRDIFNGIIQEAILAENYGFSRIWYSEHYETNNNSTWLSPEIILPVIASNTKKIKIGIAGILSYYKNPFLIASNFKLMNNLLNNRIDLGFAKGTIFQPYQSLFDYSAVNVKENHRETIMERISKTIHFLQNESEYFDQGIIIPPTGGLIPEMWNLVSSPSGYKTSLDLGVNCSRTLFFKNIDLSHGRDELNRYREMYYLKFKKNPQVNIVVTGTCQTTDKKWKKILNESKKNNDYYDDTYSLFGRPSQIQEKIEKLVSMYDVDEIIFLENSRDIQSRRESIKNISKLFDLKKKS